MAAQNAGVRPQKTNIDIIASTFKASRKNPIKADGFSIYAQDGTLFIVNDRNNAMQRHRLEDGTVTLVSSPMSVYAYFRTLAFQQLLDDTGVNRVVSQDPNRTYELRYNLKDKIVDAFQLVTDGEIVSVTDGEPEQGAETFTKVRYANKFVTVENATFVVFQQLNLLKGRNQNDLRYRGRQVVSQTNVFDLEETLVAVGNLLDSHVTQLSKTDLSSDKAASDIQGRFTLGGFK